MELCYLPSESTIKPLEMETSRSTVFLRKDIHKEDRLGENGESFSMWVYQEATMSHEDFNEYSKMLMAKNSANISTLLTGQENGDNNQLTIMEAIADLYDVIASMM